MKKTKLNLIWCLFATTLLLVSGIQYARGQDTPTVAHSLLTGREILLEVDDPKQKMPYGIYVIDPSLIKKEEQMGDSLRLLIRGASRPVWSPRHRKFAYTFNRQLWVSDLKGEKAAVSPMPSSSLMREEEGAVRWGLDGTLFYTLHSPNSGTKVFIAFQAEEMDLKNIRDSYESSFSNNFYPIVPLNKRGAKGLSDSSLRWENILSTNEATFSPDGLHIAAEVYPSSPLDIRRIESRIHIFDLHKVTEDEKINRNKILSSQDWVAHQGGYVIVSGPSKRLSADDQQRKVELMPRWSPDGKWIAYSSLDLQNETMTPVVAKVDGSDLTRLVTNRNEGWNPSLLNNGSWQPVASFNNVGSADLSKTYDSWGTINRIATEWSADGKYLWMTQGKDGIFVAKYENAKWFLRQIAARRGAEFGITFQSFNGSQAAWVEETGDIRGIEQVNIINIESGEQSLFTLRAGLQIRSMDW